MAFKRPVHISPTIIISLSVLMVFYAIFAFTGPPILAILGPSPPLFTTSRLPETGEHFLAFRRKTAPAWIYQGLHAAPAILWSILMPLQHNDSFRRKNPAAHLSKHAHSHANRYHLHDFGGLSPIPWPTFEMTLWLLAPPYYVTLYKTAMTARARAFEAHRKWAVAHTIFASAISLQRVAVTAAYTLGFVLTLFPKEKVHEFFRVGQDLASVAVAEMDMFALTTSLAGVMMVSWFLYEFGPAGFSGGVVGSFGRLASRETPEKKIK
ncbi:hypothetical protein ED733_008513 [Metarhizium rileyi]|uniref:Uncharacterized protein n=1 Tax=Metarhizium rileyi (strain RCEF 4871) TaxID=1649241 RepID=A0A5C6GN91_METRR|nr:hypothetical protein ED733_008513 [Metarhizium rileyi]